MPVRLKYGWPVWPVSLSTNPYISGIVGRVRRGARVVEGNGLENRRAGNGTEGSNPSLSARNYCKNALRGVFGWFLFYVATAIL